MQCHNSVHGVIASTHCKLSQASGVAGLTTVCMLKSKQNLSWWSIRPYTIEAELPRIAS